jgi:hypothetical protein
MIFIDAIDRKPVGGEEETKTPLKWIDDHERKLVLGHLALSLSLGF